MALMPIGVILVILALLVAGAAVVLALRQRSGVRERFAAALGEGGESAVGYDETGIARLLARLERGRRGPVADEIAGSEFRRLLHRAGWPGRDARAVFYLLLLASPVVFTVLAALGVSLYGQFDARGLAIVFAGFVLGFEAPRWGVRYFAAARQRRLAAETPILCRVLAMLLESGLNIEQSLRSLQGESAQVLPAISQEIAWLLRRLDAGASLPDALEDWRVLLDVPELADLGGLLQQVSRFGGNARQPLLDLGAAIEERQLALTRERINKLAVKMTVVMMALLFPALLVLLAGPGFLALYRALANVVG